MKSSIADDDPLDQEIDFSKSRPNPFARDYGRNRNLRVLSPDLLAVFPDSDAVDEALRAYIRLTSAAPEHRDDDPLDAEIDLSKSRPNPSWLGVVDRHCVRLLDPDVADAFVDDAAVNEALRILLETGDREKKKHE
jgi:Arc/MetJ family transcription regulator